MIVFARRGSVVTPRAAIRLTQHDRRGKTITTSSVSELNGYDLWDFGAGANSMQFAVDEIGARRPLGLNLTVDATRLAEMRTAGFATREIDVLTIPDEAQTDYISASHFFEHLPDDDACARALAIMLRATRRGIYISGPHFDRKSPPQAVGLSPWR